MKRDWSNDLAEVRHMLEHEGNEEYADACKFARMAQYWIMRSSYAEKTFKEIENKILRFQGKRKLYLSEFAAEVESL